MKKGKGALLFFATAGMELSWRYAWATFLTTSIVNQPFPFPEAITAFGLAAAITFLPMGKGWRVVYIAGIQALGFILATLRIAYTFNSWSCHFMSQAWFIEFFNTPRNPLEWIALIVIFFLALMFWVGGVTFARRSMNYSKVCSRFDLGIAAFFLLFLSKLILLLKGGIKIEDPVHQLLIFPFFVFSLLAIGIIRNRSSGPKDFLPGYRGIGVILSFTLVILLFGTGLVLFFSPYLSLAADTGYTILKAGAKPLGPVLVGILRFIFMHGAVRPEPSSGPTKGGAADLVAPAESSWWMEFFEKILAWIFGSLMGLILVVVSCIGLFYLIRWLLSRTPVPQTRQSSWHLFLSWLYGLRVFLVSSWRRLAHRAKGLKRAAELYTALRIWGRHSGLPHLLSETPLEYGFRLKHRFPSLKNEVELIIEAFQQEVYAEIILDEQQLTIAKSAWRRLRSPIHWPSRLKSWFLGPELSVF
jgi:hypothetical protein